MADLWAAITDFVAGMIGRSLAKLFFFGILLLPVIAVLGVLGLFPHKRK